MLDNVLEHVLNYNTYKGHGHYGVTGLEKSRYRAWVEANNPTEDCTPTTGKIDSTIGTGFHTYAEAAMKDSDIKCAVEKVYKGDIGGYSVGGTCDLVLYDDNDVATIADWKTMKAFPAKKAFANEETDKFIKQLSLYAYLHRQAGGKTAPIGYIYVVVVGWTQRDKAIPRAFRLDLPLMNDKEVEEYVKQRVEAIPTDGTPPKFDCPTWMCELYCGVKKVCPHYNNTEFQNTK
jgi:hypothetical protein